MICEDVELLIKEIKQQLHNKHASLMVGAGFSLNAETVSINTPLPPTWFGLKQAFVDGLYKTFPLKYQKEMSDSKTVLQLAHEYDKQFGRSSINALIKELIKDDELLPGELHKAILQLPWRDVFTTNYDTLLERASKLIVDRKYTPVYCCNDLAHSETPRIIKLHGSIQTDAIPMILTEEDYRLYPNLYAPFVNTVQQAITETTLCLVGFSGTDPNFLKWIGWVRDNLKDSMRFIYLIGKLNISDSEYQVLTNYRIKPVDLSIIDKKLGYKELLTEFISRLQSNSHIEWNLPLDFDLLISAKQDNQNGDKNTFIKLTQKWKKQREEYPNWLITPYKYREKLIKMAECLSDIPLQCTKLSTPDDIQLLYEYNWRMEHCLMPITNETIQDYEIILKRHNPLKLDDRTFFSNDAIKPSENEEVETKNHCEMWIQLIFAVLRWKREEHDIDGFKEYEAILGNVLRYYPEYTERLYYERALFALSIPDFDKLTQILATWKKHLSIPEWIIKYAALTAELGNTTEAIYLLKKILPMIRHAIPLNNIKKDYYYLSLEGIILTSLITYEHGEKFQLNQNQRENYTNENKKEDEVNFKCITPVNSLELGDKVFTSQNTFRDNNGNSPSSNLFTNRFIDNYRQRLANLKIHNCDPNEDLDLFEIAVMHSHQEYSGEVEKRNFDVITKSYHFNNSWDKNITSGYQFLRYLEVTGIPLRINDITIVSRTLIQAIRRIAQASPAFAFAYFNRVGTTKQEDFELFFSQRIIYSLSLEKNDELLSYYIKAVQWLIHYDIDKINELMSNFYTNTVINLLEAISRLLVKASLEKLNEVFNLVIKLYNSDIRQNAIATSFRNCIKRLFESLPIDILYNNLNKILQVPIPESENQSLFWVNPIDYIDNSRNKNMPISESITNALDLWIERLNTGENWLRKISMQILFTATCLHIITDKQKELFVQAVFSKVGDDGLPANTDFYPWVFLKIARLSGPSKAVEEKLLKLYTSFTFDVNINKKYYWPSYSPYNMIAYSMLLNLSVTRGVQEFRLETTDDNIWKIFTNINNAIKKYQKQVLDNNDNILKTRKIQNDLLIIDRIVAEIVIPNVTNNKEKLSQVKIFLRVANEIQPFPSSEVALQQNEKQFSEEIEQAFILAISSGDIDHFNLYSWAIVNSYIYAYKQMGPKVPSSIFFCLLSALGMRTDNIFSSICETIIAILDFYEMDQKEAELILQYLGQLEIETQFSCENSRFSYESRYDYRISACGLAALVYQKYSDKSVAMPLTLQQWKEIAHSSKEFPSLRNKWEEVINHRI